MVAATLSSKGQLVIPKDIRDRLGLKAGEVLQIEERDGEIVLRANRAVAALDARHAVERVLHKLGSMVTPIAGVVADVRQLANDGAASAWVRTSDGVLRSSGEPKVAAEQRRDITNKAAR